MPELRYNRLNDFWVIISKERAKRPHDYPVEWRKEVDNIEKCPFEPGREKMTPPEVFAIREEGTQPDTPGWKVRVIPNKYPALRPDEPFYRESEDIHDKMGGFGYHEVIIDTPDHYRHVHDFSVGEIFLILSVYRERMRKLYQNKNIYYVQIFKNHGREAGKSLYHSHSQLVALPRIPKRIDTQIKQCKKYYIEKERCLLCDEIKYEVKEQTRIVYENKSFVVYTPFASAFPFEMKIIPKKHSHDFAQSTDECLTDLSEAVYVAVRKLDKLFENPPFNMILHTSPPVRDLPSDPNYFYSIDKVFHWYLEILPRMAIHAGFELGTEFFINPTPPEEAARYLREKKIEEG
ncbi:UDPglucose--hexose-1-phosphate uridylyltransferase [Persephonella hydrogeniphila]|uniref:Galactose-1-phosphate uridylyltransferase n=1 Tax=Persephonella hydrogeniphila TaxID=198703 RepID=A0A285MYA7_9AQUI|nr:galactose-1-phosphate uridylyltransferase [Persephonella hydrogeniphila]SNZ02175.1 UDPglucose--hexose-1-phosphate uridylyltransferase [Persephonella hydrogeniphila]